MTFSKDQRDAIDRAGSVRVTIDGVDCVVVRADLFNQVEAVIADDLSHDELRAILARSANGSDWLDPSMDIYDNYDKHR